MFTEGDLRTVKADTPRLLDLSFDLRALFSTFSAVLVGGGGAAVGGGAAEATFGDDRHIVVNLLLK